MPDKIEAFKAAVTAAFRKVKPKWDSPHDTVYAEAVRLGLVAKINGMTAERWRTLKAEDEDVVEDDVFKVELRNGAPRPRVLWLRWDDECAVSWHATKPASLDDGDDDDEDDDEDEEE